MPVARVPMGIVNKGVVGGSKEDERGDGIQVPGERMLRSRHVP